jgi:DNA polymerase I
MNYSRRCAEASALKAYQRRGVQLAPGMEIGYVVTDEANWEVDSERDASKFDARYYGKLLEKAWEEVSFALENALLQVKEGKSPAHRKVLLSYRQQLSSCKHQGIRIK